MKEREKKILFAICERYIRTASPVGSAILSKKFFLSPATIRNEMAKLEKEGFVFQPYTSAGRIPTDKGLKFYVDALKRKGRVSSFRFFKKIKKRKEPLFLLEEVLKILSEISGNISIGFWPEELPLHFGLSYGFTQPEFTNPNLVLEVASIFDQLDEFVFKILDELTEEVEVFIGKDLPFKTKELSFAGTSFITPLNKKGMIGVLGPKRLPYPKILAALKEISEFLKGLKDEKDKVKN